MKKLHLFLFLGLISLFAVGCERDSREMKSFSSFIVETPSLSSDEKAVFDFDGRNIIYEEGDIIYVSGDDQTNVPFTLHREGNETDGYRWVAQGSEVVHGSTFYWCYVSNSNTTAPTYNSTKHSYYVNLDDGEGAPVTNGIVMAGNTETNVLTTDPSFAILYFTSAQVNSYSSIRVGFESNKVPKLFSISAEDGSFSDISSFSAASSGNVHSMLTMKKRGNYYYIAVPINGASVTTKLYFEYTKDGQPYQRVTSGQVTLTKGKIIRIPSEDITYYPFDADGAGKYKFSVGPGQYVRFSAGNLWFHPYKYSTGNTNAWIFATPQYNMHNTEAENIINGSSSYNNYIDLFAWATSGADGFPSPLATSTNPQYYGDYDADMTGTMDWGYNYHLSRPGIYYGSGRTTLSWRTLTIAEWQYLLGNSASRNGKWGYARINKGGGAYVYGLIILPDSYDPDDDEDLAIVPGTLNTKSLTVWSNMESDGAIFLPACGIINSTRDHVTNIGYSGYYWSATHDDVDAAMAISFTSNGSLSISTNASYERHRGLSVRLVTEDGAESAL